MAAPPVPYHLKKPKRDYMPNYPPPIYYRDTFGLEPAGELLRTNDELVESENESESTKSTVRNTMIHIYHPIASLPGPTTTKLLANQPRRKSGFSHVSNQATLDSHSRHSTLRSIQVEELTNVDQVLMVHHAQSSLWLATILIGMALQLLMFSVVLLFFDGHWFGLCISIFLLAGSVLIFVFIRYEHSYQMMWLCICFCGLSTFFCAFLFVLSIYFIHVEDMRTLISNEMFDDESNKIVQKARLTLYTLLLVYAPFCAICAAASLYILLRNYPRNKSRIHRGFFLSRTAGHQNVLVPIKLRQIGRTEQNIADNERKDQAVQRHFSDASGNSK